MAGVESASGVNLLGLQEPNGGLLIDGAVLDLAGAGQKRHRLAFAHKQAEDFLGAFVIDFYLPSLGAPTRGADQAVARRKVQELAPGVLNSLDHVGDWSGSGFQGITSYASL